MKIKKTITIDIEYANEWQYDVNHSQLFYMLMVWKKCLTERNKFSTSTNRHNKNNDCVITGDYEYDENIYNINKNDRSTTT